MKRSRVYPFSLPAVSYHYEAMATCRDQVERLSRECGERTPIRYEAEAVIMDIDALGRLLPEGAADRITPKTPLHRTH